MNLDETQKKKVAAWVAEGLKLSEIQSRLAAEFGLRMTYMETRLLLDDLKLTPKDAESAKPAAVSNNQRTAAATGTPAESEGSKQRPNTGGVSVTIDQIARPGALISGQVTFSDGNTATWYLDETNRLGIVPQQEGYRPTPADVQRFQAALEEELSRY